MRALIVGVVLLITGPSWSAAAAQAGSPAGAEIGAYRDTLVVLRDSITALSAAVFRLRRNLRAAGNETLVDGAQRLRRRCTATRTAFREARPFLRAFPGSDRSRRATAALDGAMRDLDTELAGTCIRGLAPDGPGERADSLRAHGPSRLAALDRSITAYHRAVSAFARAAGFRLPPKRP